MAGTCEAPPDGQGYLSPLNPMGRECKKSHFQTSGWWQTQRREWGLGAQTPKRLN